MKVKILRLHLGLTGAILYTQPLRYSQELLAAAAGPAVNLLCTILFLRAAPRLALVNLLLLFYNLLPLYPLDGGRILRATLHLLVSDGAATLLERIIAAFCLAALLGFACYMTCVWHAGLWPVIVCALLLLRIAGAILPCRFDKTQICKNNP